MRRIQVTQGDRYGRLTVLREVEPYATPAGRRCRRFECRCDCGTTTIAWLQSLRSEGTVSCGCIRSDVATKHAQCGTPTYYTWANMLDRCRNSNTPDYDRYGGRGITVCDRWLAFENFLADMGERPEGLTLDRIDNSGGYSRDNCRWATQIEQNRNRRDNRLLTMNGETLCLAEWAEQRGLSTSAIRHRLKQGWPLDLALTLPPCARLKAAEQQMKRLTQM